RVHVLAVELAVGTGEVDELEQAQPRLHPPGLEGVERPAPAGVDDEHLPGLDLAYEMGADDVERGRLRREHPAGVELAEAQRTEAVGIAHADEVALVHEDEAERALEPRKHLEQRELELA